MPYVNIRITDDGVTAEQKRQVIREVTEVLGPRPQQAAGRNIRRHRRGADRQLGALRRVRSPKSAARIRKPTRTSDAAAAFHSTTGARDPLGWADKSGRCRETPPRRSRPVSCSAERRPEGRDTWWNPLPAVFWSASRSDGFAGSFDPCTAIPPQPRPVPLSHRLRLQKSWGQVVTEAMACAMPVVCGKLGGYAEIIKHGENGFLFQTNEEGLAAIDALRSNPALARRVGEAARQTVVDLFSPAAEDRLIEYFVGQ